MVDKGRNHPEDDFPTLIGGTAAVSSGSSSSGSLTTPDTPTIVDLGSGSDAATMHEGTPPPGSGPGAFSEEDNFFKNGTVLAQRYEILQVLGEGGMGAVYKAKDLELNRTVALKVIRPELARNPAIVDRFKQELRLSHQVTHKNVIRIYDLGEGEGVKFITMEFIDGQDLRSLIREKTKYPPEEAVEIMRQVCQALDAAHSVNVIHRDLKPQNIIRDTTGRVLVMDFGLARTIAGDGMTQTGALVGTMEYMSPEQALGQELDQRSDLFALGLIFYELLTGKMPFHGESAIASLLKRTQERAAPVSSHDAGIPESLTSIVSKCLERDPAVRYQNVSEVLADLEVWQGKRAAATIKFEPSEKPWGQTIPWPWIGGIAVALILAVTGFLMRHTLFGPSGGATAGPAISLAIMPFRNASGDAALDWLGPSLSDMLSTDVGQSNHVRMVSPDRLHQVLHDLHISTQSEVDVATLRRVAEFTNADTLVYGQYVKLGDQIRIDTTVLDLRHDTSTPLKTDVPSEKDLLTGVDALAKDVRQKLATTPEILKELEAHALRPSTKSVQALRAYDDGLQLTRSGNNLDAVKRFEAATTEDSNFALGFSRLALTYSNLGRDEDAEKASRRAVELSDSLPARERYLIEANHARITNDTGKAIAAYEDLAKVDPGDMDVQFTLAGLYEQSSDFDAAKQRLTNVLNRDPKNVDALLARGRVEIKSSNPQGGFDFLTRGLNLAIQLDNQEEKAAILQATGIAYRMLNKPEDALSNFQESLKIKKQIGDKRGAGASLEEIAQVQDSMGNPTAALASFKESLAIRKEIGDKEGIANTYIDMGGFYHDHGKRDEALKYFNDALSIERNDLSNELYQALCLNAIGSIHLDKGEYQDALTFLDQAYQLRQKLKVPEDMAESLHNLAEANSKLGQYDKALAQYLKAIETRRGMGDQRGVAVESESMALIFAAQGRYGAALAAMQDAVKTFDQLKERTTFTVEAKSGLGGILAQAGRGDEGQKSVEAALNIAHEIKSDAVASLALNWLGDIPFYKGEYPAARQQYEKALKTATQATDRERTLISKINLAKTDVKQGKSQAAIAGLKKLGDDADSLGLKALSVECSVYRGEALVAKKDLKAARTELDRALNRAEKLGLRTLQAKAHYFIGQSMAGANAKDATPHYREVVRTLENLSKEDGSSRLLERADLQEMYRSSMKAFQGN